MNRRLPTTAMAFLLLAGSSGAIAAPDIAGVHEFLKGYLTDADPATMVATAFTDLNGDGKDEAIAYVMGPGWCGSGGCNALVLTPDGATWKVVMDATVSQLPISLLPGSSHGWRDLGIEIGGGGGESGVAEMKFNGTNYPDNPTVPPAKLLKGDGGGKVLIPDTDNGGAL